MSQPATPTVQTRAAFAEKSRSSQQGKSLQSTQTDLSLIDQAAAHGSYEDASMLIGQDIKARDVYRAYLDKAATISQDLMRVQARLQASPLQALSLQQLGALTQQITLDNQRFQNSFQHGEEQFQTYKLIQKAILNLEDAIHYWRISNRYRRFYRGARQDRLDDDTILKIKLQTATTAIEELKAIMDTRTALEKDLQED